MRTLVTGALGLIGANYAAHALDRGDHVVGFDSELRGKSCDFNAEWLSKHRRAENFTLVRGTVVDFNDIKTCFVFHDGFDTIVHAAAQVSIDKSMDQPRFDFNINVIGTFNILEAARTMSPEARTVLIASNVQTVFRVLILSFPKHA